ncbi:hypothetical protein BGZ68_005983 [Mortierella alpina]|nr:hypothetical protein BGZ68_005983 [Mortierella alpina]
MFSSFKGKLSTGLSTLQTAPSPVAGTASTVADANSGAAAAADDKVNDNNKNNASLPPPPPTPLSHAPAITPASTAQGSFGSIASRFSSSASSSALFFRRPSKSSQPRSSTDLLSSGFGVTSKNGPSLFRQDESNTSKSLVTLVQQLTMDPHDEKPDPAAIDRIREQYCQPQAKQEEALLEDKQYQEQLRSSQDGSHKEPRDQQTNHQPQQQQQPAGTALSEAVLEKLEILQRYEARFPGEKNKKELRRENSSRNSGSTRNDLNYSTMKDRERRDLASAFKRIVQQKLAAEAVLRAATPLEDLEDVEALEAHLQNLAHKSQMSMKEIGRLSEELRDTKTAKETEVASQSKIIADLNLQIAEQVQELERLRSRDGATKDGDSIETGSTLVEGRVSDVETKVSSLDLTSPSLSYESPTPSVLEPSETVTGSNDDTPSLRSSAPVIAPRDKKPKDSLKKDQALRELMVRLENVLKEKNQAQEEQEEAVEEAKYLRDRLEKEAKVNKEMAEKMDRLQGLVAEMEEREHRAIAAKKHKEREQDETVDEVMFAIGADDEGPDTKTSDIPEQLLRAQSDLESSLQREAEAVQAKQETEAALADLRSTQTALQESLETTKAELESANARVSDLQDLAVALGETKQDLVDALEEVKEKQRLLDLERLWREEAEKNRDALKREHEISISNLKTEIEQAERDKSDLRWQLDQNTERVAVSKARSDIDIEVAQLQETVRCMEEQLSTLQKEHDLHLQQIKTLSSDKECMTTTAAEQQAAVATLMAEKDEVSTALAQLQEQKLRLNSRIQDLESELSSLKAPQEEVIGDANIVPPTATPSTDIEALKARIAEQESVIAQKDQEISENQHRLQEEIKRQAGLWNRIQELEVDVAKPTLRRSASQGTARSRNTISSFSSVLEGDKPSLEELGFLKKERAELSEKLTRLERLHHGFERSSSERIEGLEKELTLLLEQKVALEAQVQEQSVLLIKEKEEKAKEKESEVEVEQARVAEGIERVRLELEAVRTAERFASSKVTELAKDRDEVIEKVAKLENRLETLKECKVGQEQSLTGRIEELVGEKEALEKQISALNTELEQLRHQGEKEREELKALLEKSEALESERKLARAQILELEMKLYAMEAKSGAENIKSQELEGFLSTVKLELQAVTKKLAIAQEQSLVQRTMHTDKVATLTSQIESLKVERDSLMQPKQELESQVQEATLRTEKLQQQLSVLEQDNERMLNAKTKAQEEVIEARSRIHLLEAKERDHKEALALTKDTMHQRDEDLSATQKLLKQAETKLEKALEKVTKLEKEARSRKEEIDSLKAAMSTAKQEAKAQVSQLTSQHSATTSELQKLKATHVKVLQERDQIAENRDRLDQEKEARQKEMQMKQAEFETLKKMNDDAEGQLREYQVQLTDARNRADTLEELTSTAKRVAETKVAEFEGLKSRSQGLEEELAVVRAQMQKDEEKLQELTRQWKMDVGNSQEEISRLEATVDQAKDEMEVLRTKDLESAGIIAELKARLDEQEQAIETLQSEALELKGEKRDLELEMQHFKDLEEILANEKAAHASAIEELKMREGHLRTLNKGLKDEVRKLQKYAPNSPLPSPATPYPPYSQGGSVPPSPGLGGSQLQQQQQGSYNTPSTSKPKSLASSANGGRAFSTPVLNLTPPSTPRFNRVAQQDGDGENDVNVEYLKNVLLNFMEHKDRRQQLIPVVAQMLRLSTEETRRFSKVV